MHTQNRRMGTIENEVIRGNIYSNDGELIATTPDNSNQRSYPDGNIYSHVVGYSQKGKTGVEAFANVELLRPNYTLESIFKRAFDGDKFAGRDVILTIDSRLQKAANEAMKSEKGAVVLLEPSTGKIKALISKPDFNPNEINNNWEDLISDDENTPLLNKAVFGLYPPGSIFKIITTKAYWDTNDYTEDLHYNCTSQITVDNDTIRCYNNTVHGEQNTLEAFVDSCNTFFINMGLQLNTKSLKQTGKNLLFNSNLPTQMEHSKSQLLLNNETSNSELAATCIGQGKTLVTPFHMAMVVSSIANDGILMKPYVVDYSKDIKGQVKTKYLPEYVEDLIEPEEANELKNMMIEVVKRGTGWRAKVDNLIVGGKTGTAQNERTKDHSWFVGFVGEEKSELAIAVILENADEGSVASQVAKDIFEKYKRSQ